MVTLNIFEIIINKREIDIYSTSYSGNWELLRKMRDEHPSLNFYSSKDSKTNKSFIYCWAVNNDYTNLPVGFQLVSVSTKDNAQLWCRIIESGFLNFMKQRRNVLTQERFSYIWNMLLNKDNQFDLKGVSETPVLNFSFHYFYSDSLGKNCFYISIRKSYKSKLTFTEEEYNKNNIDTRKWKTSKEGSIIPNRQNIKNLLLATGQDIEYKNFKKNIENQSTEYNDIVKYNEYFKRISKKILLPDNLIISDFMLSNLPNSNFKVQTIQKPQYYFHNESTGFGYYNDRVKTLKPASYNNFKNKELRILVITPKEHEGTVGTFSTNILEILKNTFHIENISQTLITFNPREAYVYSNLLKNLDVDNVDLVLQIVSKKDKEKDIKNSPYYIFKAKLINQKTPSQKVLIETIRKNDAQIKDAIALNIYSKLGGTAWTIEKDHKDKTEVIIGVSSTVDFYKNRVMGFASVLDYRGKFLTGECTHLSNLENYSNNLQTHLISIIDRIIKSKNIQEGEGFRLIFHLTKEAGKKIELKAIENALNKYSNYKIQFGIVHLSYNHNYRFYKDKGTQFPDRGSFVRLSYNQGLLHLGNSAKIPILVRRDSRSTYDDLFDMAKHILHFAHLSHRSYRPSSRPVTILYPAIMAKLVSELKEVPNWDNTMIDKLNNTLWFI